MNPVRATIRCLAWSLLATVASLWSAEAPLSGDGGSWRHPAEIYPESLRRWFTDLPRELQYSEGRFQAGDDPRWAQADWDDRSWRVSNYWDLPARAGVHWLRFRVRMGDQGQHRIPGGVMTSTVIAYELFWDGVLVGNSGTPGMSRATEVPGRVDNWFSIPAHLSGPGEHVVAIRASSYRCGFPAARSGIRVLIDVPAVLQEKAVREAVGPTLAAGAMFMVGMASLIMWLLAARRGALLMLAVMCAAIAAMQALHAMRWIFHYPADWHYAALLAMKWLVVVQGLSLVAFVVVHFALPGRWWFAGALVTAFAIVSWFSPERINVEGVYMLAIGVALSLACAIWAAWHRRRDAWPSIAGLSITTLFLVVELQDFRTDFFLKFLPATLGLVGSLALHLHDERRRAQAARLAAARLETELLKKNLQPHFLLNTLAVLTEIVEQDPRAAVKLIDDLADGFRALARVSGEKLIPLGQELELCRAHLRVMSVRLGRAWVLDAAGIDETVLVPPAVFLTLIENGFAHQRAAEGGVTFTLRMERATEGVIRLTFISPGEMETDSTRPVGGTGLRYVKARLEESFTGGWSFRDEPVVNGWRTTIEIGPATVLGRSGSKVRPGTVAGPGEQPA